MARVERAFPPQLGIHDEAWEVIHELFSIEPMGLPGPVIGVLSQDDDLHRVEGRYRQRREDLPLGGIDRGNLPLSLYEGNKLF